MNISHYGKAITYIAISALTFLVTALGDNSFSVEEILNLVVVILGAVGVYAIPNLPSNARPYAKTGIAFLTAGVIAAISFLTGGIAPTEWFQIIIAAFAAVGVYIVPNGPKETPVATVELAEAPATVVINTTSVEQADAVAEKVALTITGHGKDADATV